MNKYHSSVLLHEAIDLLNVKLAGTYIDATLGSGGHSLEIVRRGGKVLGIDADQEALDWVSKNAGFKIKDVRIGQDLILAKGNFRDIDTIAKTNGFEKISGVLFDLGVSTHQLETRERGFSFNKDARLDMRMDQEAAGVSAFELVNGLTEKELAELFWRFGEEHFAKKIAKRIVEKRKIKQIETTDELAKIVLHVRHKTSLDRTHPATRVFQALRIAVNDELYSLELALDKALQLLEAHGRIAVISFHSLEDRIVKERFKKWEEEGLGCSLTKRPITPTKEEIASNPRSRSAKLRGFKKVDTC